MNTKKNYIKRTALPMAMLLSAVAVSPLLGEKAYAAVELLSSRAISRERSSTAMVNPLSVRMSSLKVPQPVLLQILMECL